MNTQYINVLAGTTSQVYQLLVDNFICAGPAVLGGSVLIEKSNDGRSGWTTVFSDTQTGSYHQETRCYVRVTATGQNASVFIGDLALSNTDLVDTIFVANAPLASANTTAEVVLASFRLHSGYLAPNFRMEIHGGLTFTNSINSKILTVRANGIGGTAMFTSPSLASNATYTFQTIICGRGDGQTIIGASAGNAGGFGVSTSNFGTMQYNYLNDDIEFVVTATKATGAETMQLDTLRVNLY